MASASADRLRWQQWADSDDPRDAVAKLEERARQRTRGMAAGNSTDMLPRCAKGGTRMSDVVVDASIAVKWAVAEEGDKDARTLLQSWLAAGIQPVAPSWFICEVANILHRKTLAGDLSFADAMDAYDDLLSVVTILSENASHGKRDMQIARQTAQRQSYDAQYLALAERLGAEYWTDDRRFVASASASFPQVKQMGSE